MGCSCSAFTVNCSYVQLGDFLFDYDGITRTTRYLQLSSSNISLRMENFRSLHWLYRLVLQKNSFTSIPANVFFELANLIELDLSHNRITLIHPDSFTGLASLRFLDLSHNNLAMLSRNVFDPLQSLQKLVLTENILGTIPKDTFNGLLSLTVLNTDAFKFCCIATHVETCTPPGDEFSSCSDLMANYALQVFLSLYVLRLLKLVKLCLVKQFKNYYKSTIKNEIFANSLFMWVFFKLSHKHQVLYY